MLESILIAAPMLYMGISAIVDPDAVADHIREFRNAIQRLSWEMLGDRWRPLPDDTGDPEAIRKTVRLGGCAFCICALLCVVITAR